MKSHNQGNCGNFTLLGSGLSNLLCHEPEIVKII